MTYRERQALVAEALIEHAGLENLKDRELLPALAEFVGEKYQGSNFSLSEKHKLSLQLFHTMRGLDILEPLLSDSSISEIMVNGPNDIFIEKSGKLEKIALRFDDQEHLLRMISRCFGRANRNISEQKPIGSLRFEDGSRLQAVLPPISTIGPVLSIRRFHSFKPCLSELIRLKSLTPEAANYLAAAVKERKNIFVSGGTGSGKTSFLNALSAAIPYNTRVITIEDTAELDLQGIENLLRLEAREPGPDGEGAIDLESLIRLALRLRPDRIIVGEVRGKEAYAMIEAMRSGHPGSMSSGHANSPKDMIERLAMLLLLRLNLPWEAILRMLYNTLDLIVHLERLPNGLRQVHCIVAPYVHEQSDFRLKILYQRDYLGRLERLAEEV